MPDEAQAEVKPKKRKRKIPPDCKLQMTAMIDIVFLLIIFFLVVTELTKMETEMIVLPYAVKAIPDEPVPPHRIVVNVNDDGDIFVMRKKYSAQVFRHLLHARTQDAQKDSDGLPIVSVKIRAHADCRYKYVQNIMVQCMREYIWRLSFGARPTETEDVLRY